MTTPSRDGRDKPFGDWLRLHPGLDSYTQSLYSMDVDQVFCKYKTWIDSVGERLVKLMLELEIKTYGQIPNKTQSEVLFFRHQLLNKMKKLKSNLSGKEICLWHFG